MYLVSIIMGVPLSWSLSLIIALAAASLGYITLGIFIGAVSRSENTALLTSLVVGLPMMFLSGIFFPFEIMPSIMRTIGAYLPLTLSVSLLERTIIYGMPTDIFTLAMLLAMSAVLITLSTLIIRKSPMLD